MKLSSIEKKIARKKESLKKLTEQKAQILREQEYKNQEPPQETGKKKDRKKRKNGEGDVPETQEEKLKKITYSYMAQNPIYYADRKSLRELIAPDGADPNNYGFLKLEDAGRDVYVRSYYIEKMPRDTNFASTFSTLYNFPYITSDTRIDPIPTETAIKMIDKRVWDLDTELATANKASDRNRVRKISQRMRDAEGWARDLEGGRNKMFHVSFLFNSFSRSNEEMERVGSDFHNRGLSRNIALVSAYGVEPEAYKSGMPLNKLYKSTYGPISTSTVKVHQMDSYSLATIFNHTRTMFYHKNGVYLGKDLSNGRPITIDFYDQSLEAHNVIFAGKTGTGKSATIKEILSRAADFGLKYCSIDTEPKGKQGEYSILTSRLGGVNYQVKVKSEVVLNLFELNTEFEYDEVSGKETEVLHLMDKISLQKYILMAMIIFGKTAPSFSDETAMASIIEETIQYLYEIRGIVDGDPDSLLAATSGYGFAKKPLPTIHEFYVEILKRQRDNIDENHKVAFSLIVDGMKSYVRELYYIPGEVRELTKEQYEAIEPDEEGRRLYRDGNGALKNVVSVRGVRAYFDGQSTIAADLETPAINLDLSQLPKNDMPIAMVVAANWINENIIKKNSANPKRVQKRAILIDEAHRTFPYKELRIFLSDLYRSARKRHIAPIVSTQALADFKGYEETEAIVKQSPIIFMFRQARQDQEFIASATNLTPGQMNRMLTLGGQEREDGSVAVKGQVCLIVNDRVTFVQVDYLRNSETEIVETDPEVIHEYIRKRRDREYAKSHQMSQA